MENTEGQIRCMKCKKWVSSPIKFGDSKSFFSSTLVGNKLKCPICHKETDCNKENMRFIARESESKFLVTDYEGEQALVDSLE